MKNTLALLVTLILTFSCFGVLGMGTVSAEDTEPKTIITSDFENNVAATNWFVSGQVEGMTEAAGDFARLTVANTKSAYVRSKAFALTPGNKYTLTYSMRIPEGSENYSTAWIQPFSPEATFYQIKDGKVGDTVTTKLGDSNLYAHQTFSRRVDVPFIWNVEGYNTHTRIGYSDTGYNKASALYGCTGGSATSVLNNAFSTWKKVTLEFTATAETEGSTAPTIAVLQFRVQEAKNGLIYDVKDVTLTETAGEIPEVPEKEEIVVPDNIPEYPPVIEKTESTGGNISVSVSGENCQTFVDKEKYAKGKEFSGNANVASGEKVSVSASPKSGYKFIGWYENDKLITTEKHFTFNASENRTFVAKTEVLTEENKTITVTPDVNYDGVANLEDVTAIAQKLAGWDISGINDTRLDINGDGEVNLCDLAYAARYNAGWDVKNDLASKEAYDLPEEDLTAEGLAETVRAGKSEYFNRSTILNEGNRALFVKLFEKAKKGEKITVASIGGSVTQGVNSNGLDRSYGKLVSEWIADKFDVEVENINAGIGSTGSLMGVHRLQSDVLSKNPDLVILEYSVNDMSSMEGNFAYLETYESIIRRVLEKDIALMTAVFGGTGAKYYNNYLSLHIHSALHYDLPIIDYYGALFRYLDSGVIKWYDANDKEGGGITKDNLHPNFAGHVMISSAMNYYLEDVYNKYTAGEVYETAIDLPEETLFENTNLYSTATFYAGDNTLGYEVATPLFNEGFTVGRVSGNSAKLGKGWVCSSGNGVIIFEFKNITSLLIPMMNSKDYSGKYSIEINGVTKKNKVSVDQANNATWPIYAKVFDKAYDVVVKITCHEGTVGVGSIGVTY